jgi:ABC-2 type transport system ATP-binding protein
VSSHLLTEVAEVADRVVVIDRGKLLAEDSVDALVNAGGESVIVRTTDPAALGAAVRDAGGTVQDGPDGALSVRGISIERVGELAASSGIVLHELRRETATLEQAFLALTAPERPA